MTNFTAFEHEWLETAGMSRELGVRTVGDWYVHVQRLLPELSGMDVASAGRERDAAILAGAMVGLSLDDLGRRYCR